MIRGLLGRTMDVLQVGLGPAVVDPVFGIAEALSPGARARTRHEAYGARGEAFVARASMAEKVAFFSKMLGTLGASVVPSPASRGEHRDVACPELLVGGDLLQPEHLAASTFSAALRARLRGASALVLNVEGTLAAEPFELYPFQTWRGLKQLLTYAFDADTPEWVSRISAGGLSELVADLPPVVLNVANNHTMDDGPLGFARTVEAARAIGLVVGDAREGHGGVIVPVGPHRVGLFGISYGHNRVGVDESPHLGFSAVPYEVRGESFARIVADLRSRGATHVVALLHWGHEHEHVPTEEQRRAARALFDAGVSAICGHHPHLLQTTEHVSGHVVVYSLGDLVGGDRTVWSRHGALASLRPGPDGTMTATLVPTVQTPFYLPQRTMLLAEAPWLERAVHALFFRWKSPWEVS